MQTGGKRGALLVLANQQAEAHHDDKALSYLNEYLRANPQNAEALDLKAELLARSARSAEHLRDAMNLGDQVLRLQPEDDLSQKVRRRQIELYLRSGQKLQTADMLAEQL